MPNTAPPAAIAVTRPSATHGIALLGTRFNRHLLRWLLAEVSQHIIGLAKGPRQCVPLGSPSPASVGVPSVPNCPTFPPCEGTLERSWMPWPNLGQSTEPAKWAGPPMPSSGIQQAAAHFGPMAHESIAG
jgi:hypothetical protein